MQNGQQPALEALTAAEAAVANKVTSAADIPRMVVFIALTLHLRQWRPIRHKTSVGCEVHWRVKSGKCLDLAAHLRVFNGGMGALLIGDVARRTGLTPGTIRYYESIGLLSAPPRSGAGYRRYSETTLQELDFIKKAQGLGFSLEEVQEIVRLSRRGEAPCSHVLELAERHLKAVDERIVQLSRFRDELQADITKWQRQDQTYCDGVCQMIAGAPERTAPRSQSG